MNALLITSYLLAIVLANWSVATFGQAALVVTAFLLIPFDLVARDFLHERWTSIGRLRVFVDEHGVVTGGKVARFGWRSKMTLLILTGAGLSALLPGTERVALASALAFGTAGLVNTIGFVRLKHRSRLVRMNGSNALAAITDSVVFPIVAFWPLVDWQLSASQAASKFIGGVVWSVLLVRVGGFIVRVNAGRATYDPDEILQTLSNSPEPLASFDIAAVVGRDSLLDRMPTRELRVLEARGLVKSAVWEGGRYGIRRYWRAADKAPSTPLAEMLR